MMLLHTLANLKTYHIIVIFINSKIFSFLFRICLVYKNKKESSLKKEKN